MTASVADAVAGAPIALPAWLPWLGLAIVAGVILLRLVTSSRGGGGAEAGEAAPAEGSA